MKTKGRTKSANIEDRRDGKIKSPYQGLPLGPTFSARAPIEYGKRNGTDYYGTRGRVLRASPKLGQVGKKNRDITSVGGGGYSKVGTITPKRKKK